MMSLGKHLQVRREGVDHGRVQQAVAGENRRAGQGEGIPSAVGHFAPRLLDEKPSRREIPR